MSEAGNKSWRSAVSSQNPALLKKAQDELNENPDRRNQDLQKFREMILDDQKLTAPTDDVFLLRFLRARKFNHDRALKILQRYFSVRVKYPELFAAFRPSQNLAALNENLHLVLPRRDQVGRKIYLFRFGKWDPKISTFDEQVRIVHMCVETTLLEEETHVHGIHIIYDMTGLGVAHARQITPANAKKVVFLIQDCLPVRFKGFHIMFEPPIFDAIYQVVKPFLSKKLKSRIFLHGQNLESLHMHIYPEFLPEEFGGLLPLADYSLMKPTLLARDDEIGNAIANFGYLGLEKGRNDAQQISEKSEELTTA